jgi:hypothetical protein
VKKEEALCRREKEVEDKRKHDEVQKQQQEVIKARALLLLGHVQVGKIDLNQKTATYSCNLKEKS